MFHLLLLVSSLGLIASARPWEALWGKWECWNLESGRIETCFRGFSKFSWCIQKGSSPNRSICPSPQEKDNYYHICVELNKGETVWLAENTWCCGKGSSQCDTSIRKCGPDRRCQSDWCYRRGIDGTTCPSEETKTLFNEICRDLSHGKKIRLNENIYCCNEDECFGSAVALQHCSAKTDNATTVTCDGIEGIHESTSCLKSGETNSVCLPEQNLHREKCETLNDGETMWLEDSLWCCRGVNGSQIDCDTGIRKCGNDTKCKSDWCIGKNTMLTMCPSEEEKRDFDDQCAELSGNISLSLASGDVCCKNIECMMKKSGVSGLSPLSYFSMLSILVIAVLIFN